MSKITIYLAGNIAMCSDEECVDWRESVKERLSEDDVEIRNPMVRDYRSRVFNVDNSDDMKTIIEIVEEDKADIDAADIVLVRQHKPSVGTSMEVHYAWERGKLVILVVDKEEYLSPWMIYHSHWVFNTVDEAVAKVRELTEVILEEVFTEEDEL